MLKVGSTINELGAASTANEGYIVEFANRVAGVAPMYNVSAQNVMGLAATLDSLCQSAETSATLYSQVLTKMTSKADVFARI